VRNLNCKFPANGTTWGTAEIVACLPLLPVLDHHQVVGVFIELRKQKPETGIASSGQNFSISQTLLFRAVATMAR